MLRQCGPKSNFRRKLLILNRMAVFSHLRNHFKTFQIVSKSKTLSREQVLLCPQADHLLYKIIASRNQKRSTALVTNVDFDKWGEYMTDGCGPCRCTA